MRFPETVAAGLTLCSGSLVDCRRYSSVHRIYSVMILTKTFNVNVKFQF